MIDSFQPGLFLAAKLCALVGVLALAGIGLAGGRPWFSFWMSLPFGFGAFVLAVCAMVRSLEWTRATFEAAAGFAAAGLAGLAALGLWRHRQRLGGTAAEWLVSAAIAATGAWLMLLPLWAVPDLRFFSGPGTDPAGYIRVARAMQENWYFQPGNLDLAALDHFEQTPARTWVYQMKAIRDRPGAYAVIAFVGWATGVNVFQAYLIAGALLLIVAAHMAVFLASDWWPAALAALGCGLAANYLEGSFGQALFVTWLVTSAPLLVMLAPLPGAAACGFAASLLYDPAFALAGWAPLAALLWSAGKSPAAIAWSTGWMLAGMAAARKLPFLQTPLRAPAVTDSRTWTDWLGSAGLGSGQSWPLWSLAALALALWGLWRWWKGGRRWNARWFQQDWRFFYVILALEGILLTAGLMAAGRSWSALKAAWLIPPALALLGVHVLGRPPAWRHWSTALALLFAIAILDNHFRLMSSVWRKEQGLVSESGALRLAREAVNAGKACRAVIDTTAVNDSLHLITLLEGTGVTFAAPFEVWRHGAGAGIPEAQSRPIWERLRTRPANRPTMLLTATPWRAEPLGSWNGIETSRRWTAQVELLQPRDIGVAEPLISAGAGGRGFVALVEQISPDQVRFGLRLATRPPDSTLWSNPNTGWSAGTVEVNLDLAAQTLTFTVDGQPAVRLAGQQLQARDGYAAMFGQQRVIEPSLTLRPIFTGKVVGQRQEVY